jgi:cytochrome c biogenesis protein CcmG/thiol:disulfide interchange protein DsbE
LLTLTLLRLRAAIDQADATDPPPIARGQPAPDITGTTLDGAPFSLASLRGRPVIVNFWGPSCIPCRDEFPLFKTVLATHQADGLAIVGVLMDDAPAPARDFIAQYAATWPTVDDPGSAIRTSYRVAARPQSYFIDRDGVLRSIQVGELTQAEFDRQYAAISGIPGSPGVSPGVAPGGSLGAPAAPATAGASSTR